MTLSSDDAVATVRAHARERGLECTPVVLADRSNLVLHLAPHRIVARVAMATSAARVGTAWLRRELDVSRHLDALGVLVTRPASQLDPGPFERDGFVVSFWELEQLAPAPPDPAHIGAQLAAAHRALASYPPARLPEWGAWCEAREVRARASAQLTTSERHRLDHAWALGERNVEGARARSASFQAAHGDAHLGNVMSTARGVLWTDWEDAFVGPIEWDLACLRSKAELFGEDRDAIAAALAAYDAPFDPELARELGLVRNLQVIPWLALFAERQPELLPRMRARLACLPDPPRSA